MVKGASGKQLNLGEMLSTHSRHYKAWDLPKREPALPPPALPESLPFVGSTETSDQYTAKKAQPLVYDDPVNKYLHAVVFRGSLPLDHLCMSQHFLFVCLFVLFVVVVVVVVFHMCHTRGLPCSGLLDTQQSAVLLSDYNGGSLSGTPNSTAAAIRASPLPA